MPIEPDDVCLNKAAIMERAIRRLREEYAFDPELTNYSHIDALTLNIERACQAAIDLALHLKQCQLIVLLMRDGSSLFEKKQPKSDNRGNTAEDEQPDGGIGEASGQGFEQLIIHGLG